MTYVGRSPSRREDARILRGRGRYIDDIRAPGMLHAAFLRSIDPHGRIVSVDTSAAEQLPGVRLVLDGPAVARLMPGPLQLVAAGVQAAPFWPLAVDRVRFVGDPVVLVVAESRALAEDALDLIEVTVEALPLVDSIATALAPGTPPIFAGSDGNIVHDSTWASGDVAAALSRSAHVTRASLRQSRQAHVPLEPHGLVATWEPDGQLVVNAAHQNPHALRYQLAGVLGQPLGSIRVVNGDIGGSFGQKAYLAREYVATVLAARAVGAPVRWIEDRTENLLAGGHAREEHLDIEIGFDADDRITAMRAHHSIDQGAYPMVPLPPTMFTTIVRTLLPGPYHVPAIEVRSTIAATNKATHVAYRGPWEIETWGRERALDIAAAELGVDRVALRRRNLVAPADQPTPMVTGPTLDNVWATECLEVAWAALHDGATPEPAEATRRGLGVAVVMEPAPGPPDYGVAIGAPRPPQRAEVRVEPDGSVVVRTSQAPHGQSHETTLAQIAADAVGVPLGSVRVVHGDTALTPFALVGTGGSRSATFASGAVHMAASAVRAELIATAAALTGHAAEALDVVDGVVVGGTREVTLAELARVRYVTPMVLPAELRGPPEAADEFLPDAGGGWTVACHACAVDVDPRLGTVDVVRYVVAEDCGRIVNPAVVAGQIQGGVAQGIAGVLHEQIVYVDGQPVATTLMDYLMPTAWEVPDVELLHCSHVRHPLDIRGVGEGGAIGAPAALTSAIEDAGRVIGLVVTDQHLPPSRLSELFSPVVAR